MREVLEVSYEEIKDNYLFDKEGERIYKLYEVVEAKIFKLVDRNRIIAICVGYDFPERKIIMYYNSHRVNFISDFVNYFKKQNPNRISVYLPRLYKDKYSKVFKSLSLEFQNDICSYTFVPAYTNDMEFWRTFYDKKGHKILDKLTEQGYDCCTFYEAMNDEKYKSLNVIAKFKDMLGKEFKVEDQIIGEQFFNPHLSHIALYKGEPVGYLSVKNKNDIMLLDHLEVIDKENPFDVGLLVVSKYIDQVLHMYLERPESYIEVRTKAIVEGSTMHIMLEKNLNKVFFQKKEKTLYRYINNV